MKVANKIISISLVALSGYVLGDNLKGKVVGITDGDTLTFLTTDKDRIKVRLAEIDAPEKKTGLWEKIEGKIILNLF